MNHVERLAAALIIWVVTAAVTSAGSIDTSALEKFDCPDAAFAPTTYTVVCGYLNLRESADGTGRPIKLAVVVTTPADQSRAAATPTVLIHGGPGVGIVADWLGYASEAYANTGPAILFDQRGVGKSSPKLCEWLDDDDPTQDRLSIAEGIALAKKEVTRCVNELRTERIDFNAYGTDATVRDMEALRTALKIEKWNLLGVSYGTTVGLAYLANHPERVQAAVLDSVYPPEVPGFSSMVPASVSALEKLNALCAAQPACKAAFGDQRLAIEDAVRQLNVQPLRVHSRFEPSERYLAASTFYGMLQSQLMDAAGWYVIPRLIDDVRNRRATPLVNSLFDSLLETGADTGIWLATECRERAPFDKPEATAANGWPELTRAAASDAWTDICATWPGRLNQNWQTPRNIGVRTLVIGGTLDPATPAADAAATAKLLGPRAEIRLVDNAAHSSGTTIECMKETVAAFLEASARSRTPCTVAPPIMAVDLISVDAVGMLERFGDWNPATAGGLVLVAITGLIAVLLWPLGVLSGRPSPTGAPFWARSSFWFTLAAAALVVWLWQGQTALSENSHDSGYWLIYGMPVEAWPAFSLVLVSIAIGGIALVAFARELQQQSLAFAPAVHRLWVSTALLLTFTAIWQSGLLPRSSTQVAADVERTTHLIQQSLSR